jgi:hypothetical protein
LREANSIQPLRVHTLGSHKATLLSAPKASTPDCTSQSAAAGCLFPPTLMYSVVIDTMNAPEMIAN